MFFYFLTMSKLLELCACVWTVDVCALIHICCGCTVLHTTSRLERVSLGMDRISILPPSFFSLRLGFISICTIEIVIFPCQQLDNCSEYCFHLLSLWEPESDQIRLEIIDVFK